MKNLHRLAPLFALVALVAFAGAAFATDTATVDYSTNVATAVVGLVAGIAASIAAVFLIAGLVRVTRIGAVAALKSFHLIK
jgi:hypothetical protein